MVVGDDVDFAIFHDAHAGEGGAEVDADDGFSWGGFIGDGGFGGGYGEDGEGEDDEGYEAEGEGEVEGEFAVGAWRRWAEVRGFEGYFSACFAEKHLVRLMLLRVVGLVVGTYLLNPQD